MAEIVGFVQTPVPKKTTETVRETKETKKPTGKGQDGKVSTK